MIYSIICAYLYFGAFLAGFAEAVLYVDFFMWVIFWPLTPLTFLGRRLRALIDARKNKR